jgi:hypothetical protein
VTLSRLTPLSPEKRICVRARRAALSVAARHMRAIQPIAPASAAAGSEQRRFLHIRQKRRSPKKFGPPQGLRRAIFLSFRSN